MICVKFIMFCKVACHFYEIFVYETVLFLQLLFVKRVVGKSIKTVEHPASPLILENQVDSGT